MMVCCEIGLCASPAGLVSALEKMVVFWHLVAWIELMPDDCGLIWAMMSLSMNDLVDCGEGLSGWKS